jgi:hypothetical protein
MRIAILGTPARACLLCTLAIPLFSPRLACQAAVPEQQLKAAFLYQFLKFVTWPVQAGGSEQQLNLCVLSGDPLGRDLERLVAGKKLEHHALKVFWVDGPTRTRICHLLFIRAENRLTHELLTSTRGAPVLTVGEEERFLDSGGMITFVMEHDQVRFEINQRAAETAGLKISFKLLALARAVRSEEGGQ